MKMASRAAPGRSSIRETEALAPIVAVACIPIYRGNAAGPERDVVRPHVDVNTGTRRAVLARLLTSGAIFAVGSPAFVAAIGRPTSMWNFAANTLEWHRLEIATGNTLLVPARVAGTAVRAILHSGSGASIISAPFAAKLGMSSDEPRTVSGLSGKALVQLVRNVDVTLGREVRRLSFALVGDLSGLSVAFGRTIDMLIGEDMLVGSCLALDFENGRFALAKTGSFVASSDWTRVPLSHGAKKELYIHASIEGSDPVHLMFDMGSSAALMLSSAYIDAHRVTSGKATSTGALGGVEGANLVRTFTTGSLKIGVVGATAIPTLEVDNWLSVSTVGNIGLPLIAQFDVVLDVTAGFLWLRPIRRPRIPMLKNRSGLGLSVSADALTVVHVGLGSPAAAGGWAVEDRITAVNNHRVDRDYTHGSLWQWRYGPVGILVKLTMATGDTRDLRLADFC